jgi:conjugal transfer mating pair stabilization protein TraN
MRRLRSATALGIALLLSPSMPTLAGSGTCTRISETCVEPRETRTINGQEITRDCWRYQAQFDCASSTAVNDCKPLADRGCSQTSSRCVERLTDGQCSLYEQTYACKVASGKTSTITDCGNQSFCLTGTCFDTGYTPDADFAKAVAAMEAQREAGKYLDPNTLEVFRGYDNRCRKKLFGLVNCCKTAGASGSGLSTLSLAVSAGGHLVDAIGSSYTYDAFFAADAPDLVMSGFEALFGAGGGTSALASLVAGDLSVEMFVEALIPGPWSLVMLAIQLSGILDCEQNEQVLGMKRGERLCHGIGSYCSSRIPIIGTCIETKESYCCFNSRLARILNEQGRAQLGRGWGSPQSPDCSGFSIAQLQSLDFSRMDLSEFYAEIAPSLPDVNAMRTRAQQRIDSYYTR